MLKLLKIILTGIIIISFLQCTEDKDIIAEVGSLTVKKYELMRELAKHFPGKNNYKDIKLEQKKALLDQIISGKLRISDALDMRLDEKEEIKTSLSIYKQHLISSKYFEKIVINKLVTQDDIDEYLLRQTYEMKATHILVGYNEVNSNVKRNKLEARDLALNIYLKAKGGANFTELVKTYSEDPSKESNKGNLGYFKWGQLGESFQNAAWNLKIGEISSPVITNFGYHIIRLDDKREIPNSKPNTDEINVDRIKKLLYKSREGKSISIWNSHISELKEQHDYRIDNEAVTKCVNLISMKIEKKEVKYDSFSEKEKNTVLASWNTGEVKFKSLIEPYKNNTLNLLRRILKRSSIVEAVNQIAVSQLVLNAAERVGIQYEKSFINEFQDYKEYQLLTLVEKIKIRDKIELSEDQIEQYYDENIEKFKIPEEIEVWEIYVTDEKIAKEVAKKAKSGFSFEKLAKKYSEDEYYKKKDGYLGFRAKGMRAEVSKRAIEMGPGGKISAPIKFRKGWAIIKTGKKRDEIILPFKKVIPRISNHLNQVQINEHLSILEKQLKNKYSIIIDENKLAEI